MKGSMTRFSFQHSTSICDICGKPRNRGRGPARHDRCSKIRQQMNSYGDNPCPDQQSARRA